MGDERFEVTGEIAFNAVHYLRSYKGSPEPPHEHCFRALVVLSASPDSEGMAVDFVLLGRVLEKIRLSFEGRDLNTMPAFASVNPTAENIAAWIFDRISEKLNTENIRIHAVTLWETERFSVRYEEI